MAFSVKRSTNKIKKIEQIPRRTTQATYQKEKKKILRDTKARRHGVTTGDAPRITDVPASASVAVRASLSFVCTRGGRAQAHPPQPGSRDPAEARRSQFWGAAGVGRRGLGFQAACGRHAGRGIMQRGGTKRGGVMQGWGC